MSGTEAMASDHSVAEPAIARVFDMLTQRLDNVEQALEFFRRNEVYRQSGNRGRLFPELFGIKADRVLKHFQEDSVSGVLARCSLEGEAVANQLFELFMKGDEYQDAVPPDVLKKLREKFGQNVECGRQPWSDLGTYRQSDFHGIGDEVTSRIVTRRFPQVKLFIIDRASRSVRLYLSFGQRQSVLAACLALEEVLQFVSIKRTGLSIHLFQPLILPANEPHVSLPGVDLSRLIPSLATPRPMSSKYWEGVRNMVLETFDLPRRERIKEVCRELLENPDLQGGFSSYDDVRSEFTWEGVSDVLIQLEAL